MREVNWGIIGCGDVTEVKSGPALYKTQHSNLVAVMRRDGAKAADYARRHNVAAWYDDAEKLVHDPNVNAVYIATPPGSHAELTALAAAAGKPVYVEKPMARTFGECQQMIEACQSAGVSLFAAYYRRALPRFLKIQELLESGAIGDIRFVNIRHYAPPHSDLAEGAVPWRYQPDIAGAGLLFDLGAHQLDILDFLLGPIKTASGMTANQASLYPADDIFCANFQFETGVMGSALWCFTTDPSSYVELTEIVGSKGSITFSCFDQRREKMALKTATGTQTFDTDWPEHIQACLIQTVVDDLRGTGTCPSTGETAARTNRVFDMIAGQPI